MANSEKFNRNKDHYTTFSATVSTTDNTATICIANYVNPATGIQIPVGVKMFNLHKIEDIYSLTGEILEAEAFDHENTVNVHCSFKVKDELWIIMPTLPRFSLRSVIRSSFPKGIPKKSVYFILKQTLKALDYMHGKNKLHRNIDAGCIFLDEESRVKLAFRSLTYEENYSNESPGGYPSWTMAPELMFDYRKGSSKASDVWMLGLLALELFYGGIPAFDFEEFQFLVMGIEDEFGVLKKKENINNRRVLGSSRFTGKFGFLSCFSKRGKKIPEALGEFVGVCLSRDPKKRPTTNQLMEYELFQKISFEGEKNLFLCKKQKAIEKSTSR
ncbi:hypothetical protein DH2020_046841 [Rehmannia glutinosa]|uniref:Protein kinase domain-containing protein n=1 Tax=Rehmannia glutinosa TaxID=99300 RepID=A0ABR0UBQ9_REHGL